jgi:TolB protein
VLDNYVYATTSPIYFTVAGKSAHSPEDAAYFEAWTDRLAEAVGAYPDWNDPAEKRAVLEKIARAKGVFEGMK